MLTKLKIWPAVALLLLIIFTTVILLWPTEVPPEPAALPEAPEVEARGLPDAYDATRAGFTLHFGERATNLPLLSTSTLPGDSLDIRVSGTGEFDAAPAADAGDLTQLDTNVWRWKAPAADGVYTVTFRQERTRESISLKVFVKVPYDADQNAMNGYVIGQYRSEPYRDNPFYTVPDGFIQVRPPLLDERVSPHFVLGQFVSKQVSDYPKYVLLDERLLIKLELLLGVVNQQGIDTPSFHVMSAFRTPHYNRLIGNRTSYSVHLYGGAADIFIDNDGDGYMDDLNGDGKADVSDARLLAALVESHINDPRLEGGLGVYPEAGDRGPFIHVDVRGEPARW